MSQFTAISIAIAIAIVDAVVDGGCSLVGIVIVVLLVFGLVTFHQ